MRKRLEGEKRAKEARWLTIRAVCDSAGRWHRVGGLLSGGRERELTRQAIDTNIKQDD